MMMMMLVMVMMTRTMIKVQVERSIESGGVESKQSLCMHTIGIGIFDQHHHGDGDGDGARSKRSKLYLEWIFKLKFEKEDLIAEVFQKFYSNDFTVSLRFKDNFLFDIRFLQF